MGVLLSNTLLEGFHIWNRRDPCLDQSIIWCFETLLGREPVVISVAYRGLLHFCSPPPLEGEKDRADDYIVIVESGHRLLEPFAKCIFALFELIDLLL